jgi:hypothetical protein
MRVRHPAKVVPALAMALFLLSACSNDGGGGDGDGGGGGQTVPPATYVKGLCTSVQSYVDDITTLSTDFAGGIDPAASADEQKQAVLDFLDDALALTDGLIDDVDAAGVPDVDGGGGVVSAIAVSFEQARGVLEDARARVEAASTDDPQAFAAELNEVGATIQSSLGEIGGSLDLVESPELATAAADEPACAALAGAVGG